MIKHKLLLSVICLLWSNSIMYAQWKLVSATPVREESRMSKTVQDQGNGKVLYGYCSPDFQITPEAGAGIDTNKDVEVTAAIRLSEGMMHLLKERKIYRLKVGVASDTEATVFVRKADGTTLFKIEKTLSLGWNEIVPETPLDIPDEKEIYIGYSFIQHPKEYAIATASGTSKSNGLFISVTDNPFIEYSGLGNLCLLIEVDGAENEFQYVGSITSAYTFIPYLLKGTNEPAKISLNFLNEGEANVATVKLGRSFNGVELSDTVCRFKRTFRANSTGKLTFTVTPPEAGKYSYTLKELGDVPITETSKTVKFSFYNGEDIVVRMVLLEEFTSQYCGNCPAGQKALHKLINENEDRVAMVLHHSGFYPDAFSIEESDAYCYFYNSASTYAPAMTMDRTYFPEYDSNGKESPVLDPRDLTESTFLQELELPAMVSVGIKSSYDEATRKLSVIVSGYKITDLVREHIGLTVFLLESNYKSHQKGYFADGGGDFEHNDFPRYVFSEVDGDVITFDGNAYSKEYTYTIPESYISTTGEETTANPENMHIVAFVSNFDWTYPYNCMVLNANKTTSLNDAVTGLKSENAIEQSLPVFAEHGKVYVCGEYNELKVYNLQGVPIRNENLSPGIYLVKVTGSDQNEYVRKVLITD